MSKVKVILLWVAVAVCMLMAIIAFPSFASILFLWGGLALLPVKGLTAFFERHKIKLWARALAVAVIFIFALIIMPGKETSVSDISEMSEQSRQSLFVGTWSYGKDRAVPTDYKFNSDGTYSMSSQGGSQDHGTYEVTEDTVILHSELYEDDLEMTIKSSKVLEDWNGEQLKKK
jgi:hypothetical protein